MERYPLTTTNTLSGGRKGCRAIERAGGEIRDDISQAQFILRLIHLRRIIVLIRRSSASRRTTVVPNGRLGQLLVLLVAVDLGELRVDDVVLLGSTRLAAGGACASALSAFGLLVHRLAELHGGLRQRVHLGRDGLAVVALERFLEIRQGGLDRAPLTLADLAAVLGQCLLGGVDQGLGVVLGLDRGLALL